MKIAVWHDPYSPIIHGSVGGEDNLVDLEIKLLKGLGHEVFPVMQSFQRLKRKSVHVIVTATGHGVSILPELHKLKVDLIHTNNMSIASGYAWMKKSRIPIVSSFHNYRPLCPISTAWRAGEVCFDCTDISPLSAVRNKCGGKIGLLGSIRKSLFQPEPLEITRPSRVIYTSRKMANAYLERFPEARFEVIYNPSRLVLSDSYQEKNSSQRYAGFLFAGRLTAEKGIMQLLNNWPQNEILTIAGKGELEAEINRICQIKHNIRFIGTFSPDNAQFYKQFEALIFPSSWLEGSPLVVAEAISSGVPVIATDSSSAEELVNMSGCGVVVPQNFDADTLSQAIDEVRKGYDQLKERGLIAAATVFSPYSWIQKLEKVFVKTLEES